MEYVVAALVIIGVGWTSFRIGVRIGVDGLLTILMQEGEAHKDGSVTVKIWPEDED